MPRNTTIPGRVRNTASDERMEIFATRAIDNHGLILTFHSEIFGSMELAGKAARRFQSAFGMYRARARKRTYLAEKRAGRDVNVLAYEGPYDRIEAQVHDTGDAFEIRLVFSDDLYKEITITDLNGNAVEL